MQCAIVSMSGQITFDNSVWDSLNNVVKVVLIRIDYLYSVVYCDHVGTTLYSLFSQKIRVCIAVSSR